MISIATILSVKIESLYRVKFVVGKNRNVIGLPQSIIFQIIYAPLKNLHLAGNDSARNEVNIHRNNKKYARFIIAK